MTDGVVTPPWYAGQPSRLAVILLVAGLLVFPLAGGSQTAGQLVGGVEYEHPGLSHGSMTGSTFSLGSSCYGTWDGVCKNDGGSQCVVDKDGEP